MNKIQKCPVAEQYSFLNLMQLEGRREIEDVWEQDAENVPSRQEVKGGTKKTYNEVFQNLFF
jgi:hypothetical protein